MILGVEDLTGSVIGTLRVVKFARRVPEFAWDTVCTVCGAQQIHTHSRLQNGAAVCRNSACGRTAPRSSSSAAQVIQVPTAVRSADSASVREFEKEQKQRDLRQRAASIPVLPDDLAKSYRNLF